MIRVEHLNKYYFKGEHREIHVINDTTLEFEDHGLVVLLGASGSGKSSLLNVIGGLDKVDSGNIHYNNQVINASNNSAIDKYRREKIGYIFQNYLLLENYTVYDNLRIALEMIDVFDPSEQKKRITYVLKSLGILNLRKKLAKNISGGQMQRVAIARALIKNADVIIADEPTGNVDSENTIAIMQILKTISKNKLVILVTHELDIANFFADRIIEIKDGKVVNDYINNSESDIDSTTDRIIHLKDFSESNIEADIANISLFNDYKSNKTKIRLVIRNNSLYVDTDIPVINIKESSIELRNDNFVPVKKEELANYDTSHFDAPKEVKTKDKLLSEIKNGWLLFRSGKKGFVAFAIIFAILGLVMGILAISVSNLPTTDLSSAFPNDDYYCVKGDSSFFDTSFMPDIDVEKIKQLYDKGYITNIINLETSSVFINKHINNVENINYNDLYYVLPFDNSFNLLAGSKSIDGGIILSKTVADEFIQNLGISEGNYDALLDDEIIAVCDSDERVIFNYILYSYDNYYDFPFSWDFSYSFFNLNSSIYHLSSGSLPVRDDEVLIPSFEQFTKIGGFDEDFVDYYKNLTIGSKFADRFTITGFYELNDDYLYAESIKKCIFFIVSSYNYISTGSPVFKISDDGKNYCIENDIKLVNIHDYQETKIIEEYNNSSRVKVIIIIVLAISICLYTLFSSKTKIIKNQFVFGVNRCLGKSSKSIIHESIWCSIFQTSLSSMIGYILAILGYLYLKHSLPILFSGQDIRIWILIVAVPVFYFVNIIMSIIPVYFLTRKTPAKIIAKYDI